jgi:hypothetical protein
MGFELNPYDACVANKTIEVTQCSVVWYVDDNKISHVNPNVVTDIILKIEERFGKMTVTRGKVHSFLGMSFTFNKDTTVTISMKEYVQQCITESHLHVARKAASPAKKDLFEINKSLSMVPKDQADTFHSVVAKLLFVSLHGRPDILLAVSFLCTRVSKATTQDQQKLQRLLEYLNGTLDLTLTIGADDLNSIYTWVNASYAVQPNIKSHTGGVMSMGAGGIVCKSTKQKLNKKSSTEADLVGATDYIPNTIWSKKVLEAQGHNITTNFFEQDNVSAIRIEKNGRASAGKQSSHIDIRYFFMKDRLKTDGIDIRHCPTEQMLADFFTKPLQGSLFRKFRGVLMGYNHIDSLKEQNDSMSAPEERVEKSVKTMKVNIEEPHKVQGMNIESNTIGTVNTSGNDRDGTITLSTEDTDGAWSLVCNQRNKATLRTSHRYTKPIKRFVCKAHNFANNPTTN